MTNVLDAWALFESHCRDTIRKSLEASIPDGTYESEDAVDGDGMTGRPYHVRMRLIKEGGRIALDTRQSDDQARGPINFIMHAVVAIRQDNILFPPAGVAGGHAGRPGRCVVNPGRPDERVLAPMSDGNVLRRGDVMRLTTSGGGGWGNPLDRPPERVRKDVLGGFVSAESAREDYGVLLGAAGAVDPAATARLQASRRGPVRMFHRNGYFGPLVEARPAFARE